MNNLTSSMQDLVRQIQLCSEGRHLAIGSLIRTERERKEEFGQAAAQRHVKLNGIRSETRNRLKAGRKERREFGQSFAREMRGMKKALTRGRSDLKKEVGRLRKDFRAALDAMASDVGAAGRLWKLIGNHKKAESQSQAPQKSKKSKGL